MKFGPLEAESNDTEKPVMTEAPFLHVSFNTLPSSSQNFKPVVFFFFNVDHLKSRDITLPTKVHLIKAMVFPVVRYGCESWTRKKAEGQRIYVFELWFWADSWESLGLQGDQTNQS